MNKNAVMMWLCIVVGPLVALLGLQGMAREKRMGNAGHKVVAQVVSVQEDTLRRGSHVLEFKVSFHPDGASAHVQQEASLRVSEHDVDDAEFQRLRSAATIPVTYLPDDPDRVTLQGAPANAWMMLAAGLVIAIFGIGSLVQSRRENA